MKQKVPISVIIPAYNREGFIAEAVESVQAQTVQVEEIIVVDNNCTDRTVEIAKGLGARILKRKKAGPPAARNKGIAAATGEWIALLDSDDWWLPQHLEYLWEAVHIFPQARVAFSHLNYFFQLEDRLVINEEPGNKLPRENLTSAMIKDAEAVCCERMTEELLPHFWIIPSASMFHREVFSLAGMFDENIPFIEDIDLNSRMMARFPTVMVRKPLGVYRMHREDFVLEEERRWKNTELAIEKMRKKPEDYPPGCYEFHTTRVKHQFIAKHLTQQFIIKGFQMAQARRAEKESKKKDA